MISTLLRAEWLNLKRDRVALALTFVLPIVFFTIFAAIFGGMASGGGGDGPSSIRVLVVDEDATNVSAKFVDALADQDALDVRRAPRATDEQPDPPPFTREQAQRAVRTGKAPAAIVIPAGFGDAFGTFDSGADPVTVIHDPSNPLARYTVSGLIQASAMMAAPDVLMERGLGMLETAGGALTEDQREAVDEFLPFLRGDRPWEELDTATDGATDRERSEQSVPGGPVSQRPPDGADTDADADSDTPFTGLVTVETLSARAATEPGEKPKSNSIISYYAAGIGVMFLLFSMAGAAGSLLEEEEHGTLERLLGTCIGMPRLLAGKWVFFSLVGIAQLTLMFVYGAVVFDLDLFTVKHLVGFAVMTVATAASAAAFGIALATICRSRAQLSGISTVVILVMSALGGSMVPRFVMPAFMHTTSRFTFNGWALDGYLAVFWYDDPAASLAGSLVPVLGPVAVLIGLTAAFLLAARALARRWERV